VTTVEADDLGLALAKMISSDQPFESWYRERLQELHGVRLNRYLEFAQPAMPDHLQELLFEWKLPANGQG
jgi:hypothetical protein